MKRKNLTSILANVTSNIRQRGHKLHNRIFRREGMFWQRFFATLLLVSSILLSPAGSIRAYALAAPDLIGPTDGSINTVDDTPPLGIPEFSWNSVAGATKYRLQVSSDISFTTRILDITTSNTKFTPISSVSFSDGVWFWRVRVESPGPAGSYSSAWSFTKQWATPENLPSLISPADFETIDFFDHPVFSWNPVTGAAKYKLQIYASAGGWSSLTYSATTLATTHQPNAKLANGTYYWRVVPVDAGAHDGTPSLERSFITGYSPVLTLLEPDPDQLTFPTFTPTFRWTAVRGAQYYRLQYSTDPTFNTSVTQIDTRNSAYTPTVTLPNDVNYYWRVRVFSGSSITDWTTASFPFYKQWYIKPVLLTPTLGYQNVRFPLYSWTPVPGAAYYKIDISLFQGMNPMYDSATTANAFYTPSKYDGGDLRYYWQVTPYDGNGKAGKTSDQWSYDSYYLQVAPQQVYPFYYYPPDTYPGFSGVTTNPHENRTAPLPIFIWHRVLTPALDLFAGQVYGDAYRLQVSTDPTFTTVNWTVVTENMTAAPTTSNPFSPLPDTDYFWRVCVLSKGYQASSWSQTWKVQFDLVDPSIRIPPTSGAAPTLLRPTTGFEYAEETPLLEWFPLSGADSYDVEISQDADFSTIADSATVPYPAYAPTQSLAQRTLGALDFGIYYWRVRQTGSTTWSETRRYQISAQSQWRATRRIGELVNPALIGTDPAGDANDGDDKTTNDYIYDLTDLLAVQTATSWHFGFHIPFPSTNVVYEIYIDLNNVPGSGATSDVLGYDVTTVPSHQPEYAIKLQAEGGVFSTNKIYFYHWNGSGWSAPYTLASIGGRLSQYYDTEGYYVEFLGPNTAIGFDAANMNHYYMSLLSMPEALVGSDGKPSKPIDSAPSDPKIFGSGPVSNFATLLYIDHPWQIGSDPAHDVADPNNELTDLHVGQDRDNWYFGFHIPTSITSNVTYALYLDTDHLDGSGATFDARGYSITTISAYRPEYAIYILQENGIFSTFKVYLYHWTGSAWSTVYSLDSIGGRLGQYSNECNNYVELQVPNTAIGYQTTTGSYSISMFSLPPGGSGQPIDSVPSDPNVPGSGPISRFANVTERMNLSMPPNNAAVDPSTYASILPFFWDFPILAPWAGAIMKAYLDPGFTTEVATYTLSSTTAYYAQTSHSWGNDFTGDNTYYWRIQPRYLDGGLSLVGAWSQGWRFERTGFVPQNLHTSVTFATPTFSWDKVEGAESYDLQVDDDPGFGSPAISINATKQNSYTDSNTLANGTYYWRVRVRRNGGVINDWTASQTFILALPAPAGLTPPSETIVGHAPTLCWTPQIINSATGDPVFAAWKYRLQISTEPTFSTIYETIDTEQSCWTPINGYSDGEYYWHVATIDGNGKLGNYSAYQTFIKQYPITTLVSPVSGTVTTSTPTFVWTPVYGAAKYKLNVSQYSNFSTLVDTVTTDNTRYTPTFGYTAGKTYYWRVAIVDNSGKIGPYTDAIVYSIDTTAPETQIDTHPANPTNSTSADFTFSSDDPTATFECSLDGSAYAACTSPTNYTSLLDGSHTFAVQAMDTVGNVDATPASYTWTIDTTAPDTQINSHPANLTNSASATFTFSSPDATATFECSLNGSAYTGCVSPMTYIGLVEGGRTFAVHAKDLAGNVDATPAAFNWTIDRSAPDTQINSHPASLANSASATFTFSSPDGTATFECSLNGGAYAACSSPKDYTGLADGARSFVVRAKDPAGNVDASPASYAWTIDTTAPDTQINSHPVNPTNSTSAAFTFSSSDGTATFECSLDSGAYAVCSSPQNYTGLAVGSHTFTVRAKDPLGNVDATPASYTWTINTIYRIYLPAILKK